MGSAYRAHASIAALLLCVAVTPAWADDRDYCPARPGLGTPACTIAPGRISVEVGLADWQHDADATGQTDSVLFGDTLVRVGLGEAVEAQIGWSPFGIERTRDTATGIVGHDHAVGDVLVGLKANLLHPDGNGLSFAIQPCATLPTGRSPVGAGDWGAGLVAPVTYDLSDTVNLEFTPEIDAAVDEDGNGRHVAFSGIIGLGYAVSDQVGVTIEVEDARDHDPSGHTTQWLSAASLAWTPATDLQLDIGANLGLNADAPDTEVYVGISRRF